MTDTLDETAAAPDPGAAPEPFIPPTRDPRWDALAAPFRPDEIEKLPKQIKKDDQDRYQCRAGTKASADGYYCGGYHARSIHLDYVGHAGVTTRLNAVDPTWTWEAMYRDVPHDVLLAAINTGNEAIVKQVIDNAPMRFTEGGLWIRLTILGVTRPGFGDAGRKNGPDAVKEVIGDAIRNAGMRFGVATYLWSKSARARAVLVDEDDADPVGHGEHPRVEQPAATVTPLHRGPVDDDTVENAAQRVIRLRKEARDVERAAARQVPSSTPAPAAPTSNPPGGVPEDGPVDPVAFIAAVLDAHTKEALSRLFEPIPRLPHGPRTNLRAGIDDTTARILADVQAARPNATPLVKGELYPRQLVLLAGWHLEIEGGMSIHDHLNAESAFAAEAPVDPTQQGAQS